MGAYCHAAAVSGFASVLKVVLALGRSEGEERSLYFVAEALVFLGEFLSEFVVLLYLLALVG